MRKRAVLEKEGGPREKEDGPGVPHLRCAARVRAPMRARGRDRLGRPGAAVEHSHLRLPPALPPTKKRFWSNRCFGSVIYTGAPRSPPPPVGPYSGTYLRLLLALPERDFVFANLLVPIQMILVVQPCALPATRLRAGSNRFFGSVICTGVPRSQKTLRGVKTLVLHRAARRPCWW